jgi:hypothetical protein
MGHAVSELEIIVRGSGGTVTVSMPGDAADLKAAQKVRRDGGRFRLRIENDQLIKGRARQLIVRDARGRTFVEVPRDADIVTARLV